ncbi:Chaperone surA [Gossypium australe]|uniref:Chaperone surA n=1 Tax=Gossypium australe TaxID=47621 RepID=A0A5B6W8S7_9ROSI|nr:Chaperone surA [Gossypium australe]
MGIAQVPQPPQQPPSEVVQPVPSAHQVSATTQFKGDPLRDIHKQGAKEFLRDKGDGPASTEQWLSDCTPADSLLCVVSLLEGEAYQWWETLLSVTPGELID